MQIRNGRLKASLAVTVMLAGCYAAVDDSGMEMASSMPDAEVGGREEALLAGCDDTLLVNEYLVSPNGQYRLYMQGDGNLVLRNVATQRALWASGTNGKSAIKLVLQTDGNLVLYTASGTPVWSTATVGQSSDSLRVNDNGSLVLYAGSTVVWSANGSSSLSTNATANSQLCSADPGTIIDACPNDATKTVPGLCGCGIPESNTNCSASVKRSSFTWSGASVDYVLHAAQTNWSGNNSDGVRSTPAKSGDFEIVSFGASHGGDTSTNVNTYFDRTRMVNQGFQPIAVRGETDKKAEMWVRKNSGQRIINVPFDATAYSFLAIDGNDVQLSLSAVTSASRESAGQPYQISTSSGTGLKILTVFSDDSVELLNVGNGTALYQTWGFGDGDGFAVVLYPPSATPPSSITVRRYDSGGFQYVALMSTFPKQ